MRANFEEFFFGKLLLFNLCVCRTFQCVGIDSGISMTYISFVLNEALFLPQCLLIQLLRKQLA